MASYTSSNTNAERWAKIVAGVDSGRYPEIMIDDVGNLVAVSSPTTQSARIQSFLADVFKDGDSEWFCSADDSIQSGKGEAVDDGQPESSKKKKISLTQQRANARQEKKDQGLTLQRAELTKDKHTEQEWMKLTEQTYTRRPTGVYPEEGKIVATDHDADVAQKKLDLYVALVLGHDTSTLGTVKIKMPRRPGKKI